MSQALHRCWWCGEDPLYQSYHDHEWGRPVTDNIRLFEKISLEGFQAGLSWITILRKRNAFRDAFDGFDYHLIQHYNEDKVSKLLQDSGIVRHAGKIRSVINNAARAVALEQEFGDLGTYFWSWMPPVSERPKSFDAATLKKQTTSESATALSKDLKKRGWSFVGPTTLYAFMQAMGMVNDHVDGCWCRDDIQALSLPIPKA